MPPATRFPNTRFARHTRPAVARGHGRPWGLAMYKKILLAYDGSDAGQTALLDCRELANWSQSELHLVAVMPSAMSFVGLEGGVYDMELEEREKTKYDGVLRD